MLHSSETGENNDKNYTLKQLQDYEEDIAWKELEDAVESYYLESYIGRLIVPTETMLRVYFLQRRYNMSALVVEEALFNFRVLREFALIDIGSSDVIPNMPYIESFHLLIKEHELKSMIDEAFGLQDEKPKKKD